MKSGIDYFPLDVNMDEKVELIEAEFGLTGFAILVKLLQRIYGGEGWYVEWTNEVALLFAKRVGAGGSVVSEIVEALIKRGIFDKTLYDKYHILTSAGIQRRYFEAVSRRKNVKVKAEYLLVNATDFLSDVDILSENVCTNKKNADILKQSKVEKSKVYNTHNARTREGELSQSEGEGLKELPSLNSKEFQEQFNAFTQRWSIAVDSFSPLIRDFDFDKLSHAYERSGKFLQCYPTYKCLSWIVKNYASIIAGKYDDHERPEREGSRERQKPKYTSSYDPDAIPWAEGAIHVIRGGDDECEEQ